VGSILSSIPPRTARDRPVHEDALVPAGLLQIVDEALEAQNGRLEQLVRDRVAERVRELVDQELHQLGAEPDAGDVDEKPGRAGYRRCAGCGRELPGSEFSRGRARCRGCRTDENRAYRARRRRRAAARR
jgi:hypothetical protein